MSVRPIQTRRPECTAALWKAKARWNLAHREIRTFWKGLERCYSFQKCFFIADGKSTKWMSVISFGAARRTPFTHACDCVSLFHSFICSLQYEKIQWRATLGCTQFIQAYGFFYNKPIGLGIGMDHFRSNGADLACVLHAPIGHFEN